LCQTKLSYVCPTGSAGIKPLYNFSRLEATKIKAMGIQIELLIAAADIALALLVAISLPTQEEPT
jgi:hypothetical protein